MSTPVKGMEKRLTELEWEVRRQRRARLGWEIVYMDEPEVEETRQAEAPAPPYAD